jgi:membrane-associated phospholipid phosphatase
VTLPSRDSQDRDSGPTPRRISTSGALLVVLIAAGSLVALARFAQSPNGRSLDEQVLNSLNQQSGNGVLLGFANFVNHWSGPILIVWSLGLVVVAVRRPRQRTTALVMVAFAIGGTGASELLKLLVAVGHSRLGESHPASLEHTWPSTHAAAASALAMASIAVSPTPRCAAAAVASAAIMSVCLLMTAAHFPSDVLAGWLMAGCSVAMANLVLQFVSRRRPNRSLTCPTLGCW